MAKKPTKSAGTKTGRSSEALTVPANLIKQGDLSLYQFTLPASQLWKIISINRRGEDEDRGYQRVLSHSRVEAVADHIKEGKPIPTTVVIALDAATYDDEKRELTIPPGEDIGWVIDGQHRIAGAHEAASERDISLPIVAFVGASLDTQIQQFITINREAKNVPTSLVYDLLSHLPPGKTSTEAGQERAAEIANTLRKDKDSAFFNRIVVMNSPRNGQVSITNFVRKVLPLVHPERGTLRTFKMVEQTKIIDNYFSALKSVFKDEWTDNTFFKTIGFGAMFNMFDEIFQITISEQKGFTVPDIVKTITGVRHFNFEQWNAYGTGSKAEIEAAKDFRTDFNRSRAEAKGGLRL